VSFIRINIRFDYETKLALLSSVKKRVIAADHLFETETASAVAFIVAGVDDLHFLQKTFLYLWNIADILNVYTYLLRHFYGKKNGRIGTNAPNATVKRCITI
jgi:hypothetical protein